MNNSTREAYENGDLEDSVVDAILQMAQDREKILVDRNSPIWGLFLILECALLEVKRTRAYRRDVEQYDATPFADPSWERGHEYGQVKIMEVWEKALSGVVSGGTYGDPTLQDLYTRTVALVKRGP